MIAATSIPRMYADQRGLKHGDLTEKLIGIFFSLYNELGTVSSNPCTNKRLQSS
jgi:hypothetical protein